MNGSRFAEVIQRHRLLYGVLSAICIGLLLTVISMSLYISSGASQLDLSRPGYERARTQVNEISDDEERFNATGPMNVSVVDEFQELFSKRRATINASDSFDSAVLDDAQLKLSE